MRRLGYTGTKYGRRSGLDAEFETDEIGCTDLVIICVKAFVDFLQGITAFRYI
jgi:hypothetical protein